MELTLQQTFLLVLASLVLLFATASGLVAWLTLRTAEAVKLTWISQLKSPIHASWLIVLLFAIGSALRETALSVIFAVSGPFGTYGRLEPWPRLIFWLVLIGGSLTEFIHRLGEHHQRDTGEDKQHRGSQVVRANGRGGARRVVHLEE